MHHVQRQYDRPSWNQRQRQRPMYMSERERFDFEEFRRQRQY